MNPMIRKSRERGLRGSRPSKHLSRLMGINGIEGMYQRHRKISRWFIFGELAVIIFLIAALIWINVESFKYDYSWIERHLIFTIGINFFFMCAIGTLSYFIIQHLKGKRILS